MADTCTLFFPPNQLKIHFPFLTSFLLRPKVHFGILLNYMLSKSPIEGGSCVQFQLLTFILIKKIESLS